MAAPSNLVLQLLITAKDEASAIFGTLFSFLDRTTSATANLIREKFTDLFGGGLSGAIEFEAQLDRVQAKGSYTAEVMATLKQSAEDIGAQFGISGTEAAQGMESLAAAGLTAEQVIQTLPTVLSLAKAEALSFDAASALVANSLTTVGLGFEEAGRLADVLTQAANESTTSASAVGKALETAGGIARASSLDLEQTVAALTALAKGGIEGERAGTALAAILTQLLNPASAASKALDALGITSRDLGTVIGELESRGAGANTAILAFGETAGPGLRALIGQGQGALTELETSMRDAGGAASNAAEQMGGNLKTALSSLESAWQSVKTALLEPVLEPLAKAANDASAAINVNLKEGALEPVQAAIKAVAEGSLQFARDFLASFDFKSTVTNIQEFAAQVVVAFTTIGDYGGKAANVVQIAWNTVTGTVKGIGAVMVEITASVVATLANVEEAAAKIGLGSVERANELRQKALEMQETAKALAADVKQDVADLGGAYDRLTTNSDQAADAQEKLKAALPVAELQTLTKTLDDYRGIAERANAQAAQAAKDFADGKISAQDYGAQLLATAEANQELADQIQATAKATTFGKEALDGQLNTLRQTADANAELADAQDAVRQSALNLIQAEIELARAKGDTAEVTRLLNTLADTEIEQARAVAAEKAQEAENLRAQLANRLAYRASLDATNAALEQEIQLLIARTAAANNDADAAQRQLQALEEIQKKQQQQTQAAEQNTQATEKNTEATKGWTQEQINAENAGRAAVARNQQMADTLRLVREQTEALSEKTRELFETLFAEYVRRDEGFASLTALNTGLESVRSSYGALTPEIARFQKQLQDADAWILQASSSTTRWYGEIAKAQAEASLEYLSQEYRLNSLISTMEDLAQTGRGSLYEIQQATLQVNSGFDLLDDQDLFRLRDSIDRANDKLKEMSEITQSAKDRLTELNIELLEAQGLDQKADLLRQQLDYQQDLAEVEAQRQEAELMGNRELLALLDQQEQKLRALNDLRVQNIQNDAATADSADQATRNMSRLADEAERANQALAGLSGVSLSGLTNQSETLRRNFSDLNSLL